MWHFKFGSKSNSQLGGSVAYVTNLGARRSTDVPFTVDGLGGASLPVSGDLMGLDDTFWTNHVILTGWNTHICINTHKHAHIETHMQFKQPQMDSQTPGRWTNVNTLHLYNTNIYNWRNSSAGFIENIKAVIEYECENKWDRKIERKKHKKKERERGREYTYRAEVGGLPSLQSPDLRREQKRGGGAFIFNTWLQNQDPHQGQKTPGVTIYWGTSCKGNNKLLLSVLIYLSILTVSMLASSISSFVMPASVTGQRSWTPEW